MSMQREHVFKYSCDNCGTYQILESGENIKDKDWTTVYIGDYSKHFCYACTQFVLSTHFRLQEISRSAGKA